MFLVTRINNVITKGTNFYNIIFFFLSFDISSGKTNFTKTNSFCVTIFSTKSAQNIIGMSSATIVKTTKIGDRHNNR